MISTIYIAISSISIITVVSLEWSNGCAYPLKIWLLIQFFIQISQIGLEIIYFRLNLRENNRSCFGVFITLLSRLNNLVWLSWFIIGMIWTFQAVKNYLSLNFYFFLNFFFYLFIFLFFYFINVNFLIYFIIIFYLDFFSLCKNFYLFLLFLFYYFIIFIFKAYSISQHFQTLYCHYRHEHNNFLFGNWSLFWR